MKLKHYLGLREENIAKVRAQRNTKVFTEKEESRKETRHFQEKIGLSIS